MTTATDRYIAGLDEIGAGGEEHYYGPLIGLRTIKGALRRHRSFWPSCAVLGLLVGAAFHFILPAKYVAVTTVYLTEPTSGEAYTVADDVNLLETNDVAYQAMDELHINNKNHLPGDYDGVALGDVLMEITADGKTSAAAVSWAKALASAFFEVRERTLGGQTQLVIAALETQETQLEKEVRQLGTSIDGLTQSEPDTSTQLAVMVSERSTDQAQLTTLQSTVQQDQLEENAVNKGSYVLDPAQAVPVSTKKIFAEDGLSGLVAGLAIGMGLVVVGATISDRPRRRSDVASLLGAAVELSLQGPAERGLFTRANSRRSIRKPGRELRLAQRYLARTLDQLHRPEVALVFVGDHSSRTATAVVVGSALSLASEGKRVALVDMAEERPLARLFKVRFKDGALRTVKFGKQQLQLAVAPEDIMAMDKAEITKDADLVLLFANADPAQGAQHLTSWVEDAVVVLRAGKVSDTLIEATGQMLREARVLPISAILIGADKEDETSGAVDGEDLLRNYRLTSAIGQHGRTQPASGPS